MFRLVHETAEAEDDSPPGTVDWDIDLSGVAMPVDFPLVDDCDRVSTPANVEKIVNALHAQRSCLVETQSRRIGRTRLVAMLAERLHSEYNIVVLSTCWKRGDEARRMLEQKTREHSVVFVPSSAGCRKIDDDVTLVLVDDASYTQRDVLRHYCQSETRQCVTMCYPGKVGMSNDDVEECIRYSSGRGVKSARKR